MMEGEVNLPPENILLQKRRKSLYNSESKETSITFYARKPTESSLRTSMTLTYKKERRDSLLETSTSYLEGKLKLTVNREKGVAPVCSLSENLSSSALHWEGTGVVYSFAFT